MFTIATTRFNSSTWEENKKWREDNKWEGCIYNIPIQIKETTPVGALMFILEMNNDRNKIMGVGLIQNRRCCDKYYRIYDDGNYNRYTYKSKYRLGREDLTETEKKMLKVFDILLFKGACHLKRGQGITTVPNYIIKSKFKFMQQLRDMFATHFKPSQ